MPTQFVVIPVLSACICFTLGVYFLVRHPRLVERYVAWFRSLSSNSYALFAALFGALTMLGVYDRFWFGVAVYGAMTCAFVCYAVRAAKKPAVEKTE